MRACPSHQSLGLPGFLVISSVASNAVLAFTNAHIASISSTHVILAEVGTVGLAMAWIVSRLRREMAVWFILILLLIACAALRALATGGFEPKLVRDAVLIPVFVMLGISSRDTSLDRTFFILHGIVFTVLVVEVFFPELYEKAFSIQQYYINTRGFSESDFWNPGSSLFLSATRPGERFLSWWDGPRASSIFLEPVTLGNYCVVVTVYLLARYGQLSVARRLFYILALLIMTVACDGRLATVTMVALLFASPAIRHLPAATSVVYLPATSAMAVIAVLASGIEATGDDFPGRVSYTVRLLTNFDTADWLGLSNDWVLASADSGLAYLIATHSIIGVAMIWALVTIVPLDGTQEQRCVTHGLAIFLSLAVLVSYSIVTIKIAAPMWFLYGSVLRHVGSRAAVPSLQSQFA